MMKCRDALLFLNEGGLLHLSWYGCEFFSLNIWSCVKLINARESSKTMEIKKKTKMVCACGPLLSPLTLDN